MAGEKTEKATPKKRKDERKEGNVFKSVEINNSITMISAVLVFAITWRKMLKYITNFFTFWITESYTTYSDLNIDSFSLILLNAAKTILIVCAPITLAIMVSGVFSNYIQVGFLFTPKSLKPKLERISIIKGFKRMFSTKTLMNLAKSILKILIIILISYKLIKPLFYKSMNLMSIELINSIEFGVENSIDISYKLLIAMVSVSIIDFIFQWLDHEKKLKMSKQDIRDEYKTTEGNPEIKSRIRQAQQKFAASRMMQDVPNADVIITNPTHYAVALKYDREKDNAPIVIAKGANNIAMKIKEIAKNNKIEIIESKELARSLYKSTEIGNEIPLELFNAVAEILAYIYMLKDKKKY